MNKMNEIQKDLKTMLKNVNKHKQEIQKHNNAIDKLESDCIDEIRSNSELFDFYYSYRTYKELRDNEDFIPLYFIVNNGYHPIVTHIVSTGKKPNCKYNDLILLGTGQMSKTTIYDNRHVNHFPDSINIDFERGYRDFC